MALSIIFPLPVMQTFVSAAIPSAVCFSFFIFVLFHCTLSISNFHCCCLRWWGVHILELFQGVYRLRQTVLLCSCMYYFYLSFVIVGVLFFCVCFVLFFCYNLKLGRSFEKNQNLSSADLECRLHKYVLWISCHGLTWHLCRLLLLILAVSP